MPLVAASIARLSLILIIVGGVCTQAQIPKEGKGRSQNQQALANQQTPTPQPQATPAQVSVEQPKADDAGKERQEQQEQPKGWFTPEWATVITNALLLVVILFQTAIYAYQLSEMRKLKGVSERQADTMETQVGSMQAQLEVMKTQTAAMQESLDETRNIVAQNERAVVASETQARIAEENAKRARETMLQQEIQASFDRMMMDDQLRASQATAKAAGESAKIARDAFYVGEAPYFGITGIMFRDIGVGSTPEVSISFSNVGRTPAWQFNAQPTLIVGSSPDSGTSVKLTTNVIDVSNTFVPAGDYREFHYEGESVYTQEMFEAVDSGRARLFIVVKVRYRDMRKVSHPRTFRCVWHPASGTFEDYDATDESYRQQTDEKNTD
ncbi:MAG TPA: hypothetical protein VF064_04065 [Pyrinomonadaceae bacterium]